MTSANLEKRPPLFGDLRRWGLVQAECIDFMRRLPAECVDSVVTDPPYGIAFGGKSWDGGPGDRKLSTAAGFQEFTRSWSEEALRILKPGGHLVAFGASRTGHRLTAGIEDAGFEIRDSLAWLYSSGMPKSRRLDGDRGSALKPAYEPIVLARKALALRGTKPGTVIDTFTRYGTGPLNVGECRIERASGDPGSEDYWPPNVVLAHDPSCSNEACAAECPIPLIDQLGDSPSRPLSRIFHAGKASQAEREAGLEALDARVSPIFSAAKYRARARANIHPTVKPLSVCSWAIRLVTPSRGLVLDPFAGSGSLGCAAMLAGRAFIGIERESEYVDIARARVAHWAKEAHRLAS